VGAQAGRAGDHGALAADEERVGLVAAAAVHEDAFLAQLGQVLQVAHVQRGVDGDARVQAAEAVVLGGVGHVVPGRERFQLDPRRPGGRVAAFLAGGLQLLAGGGQLFPGLGGIVGVQAGLLEGVLVVVEHHGRAVEGHRHQLAVGRRVVAGHGADEFLRIDRVADFLGHLLHRLDGALGVHHGGGAHFEDLQDVGRVAGAERGDAGVHGFTVVALVNCLDLVVGVLLVEFVDEAVHAVAQGAFHRVPELDLGGGMRGGACESRHDGGKS
uniref:Chaperone protein DnaK n=1 Tax=Parastrongyloides trichosuri TaxID=131310 RepID=A0A0N4ZAQ2_PARTI